MGDKERRKYPRFSGGTRFSMTGPTGSQHVQSLDQGPGGAFLETTQVVREGSKIILTVHDPFGQDQPVFLVAHVVSFRKEPRQGVAIEWQRAICRFGVERLKQFLDTHFHLIIDPRKTGVHAMSDLQGVIYYDFKTGQVVPLDDERLEELKEAETFYAIKFDGDFLPRAQYLEVRLLSPHAERTSRKMMAEMSMDMAALHRVDEYQPDPGETQPIQVESYTSEYKLTDSELDQWKYEMKKRKKSRLPALLMLEGKQMEAVVKNICRTDLFLLAEAPRPDKGDRAVLELPVTLGNRSCSIVVVAEVTRIARDRKSSKLGLDLKVLSVDEQGEEGLFDDYLLAL